MALPRGKMVSYEVPLFSLSLSPFLIRCDLPFKMLQIQGHQLSLKRTGKPREIVHRLPLHLIQARQRVYGQFSKLSQHILLLEICLDCALLGGISFAGLLFQVPSLQTPAKPR